MSTAAKPPTWRIEAARLFRHWIETKLERHRRAFLRHVREGVVKEDVSLNAKGKAMSAALPTPGSKAATPHSLAQMRGQCRTLATRLTDAGCDLEQIQRIGDFAVFHRTKDGRCRGYELVRIRRHEARQTPFGCIEAGESYPTANSWGKDAVSITDLDEAMERLHESVRMGAVASWVRMERKGT